MRVLGGNAVTCNFHDYNSFYLDTSLPFAHKTDRWEIKEKRLGDRTLRVQVNHAYN